MPFSYKVNPEGLALLAESLHRSLPVGFMELNGTYQRLRDELDAAYSGPVWNSSQIDRIAEQIAQVEFALASAQHAGSRGGIAARHSSAESAG